MTLCDEKNWKVWTDSEGVLFSFPKHCPLGRRSTPSRDLADNERAALLRLVAEQCEALEIKDGIRLEWAAACQLPTEAREVLGLPREWLGSFGVEYTGLTKSPDFKISLKLIKPNGEQEQGVNIEGRLFKIGPETYLADWSQYKLLQVVKDFEQAREVGLTQYESLSALEKLQALSSEGLEIDLNAFDELEILRPNAVRVAVEQKDDGSINISPDLCEKKNSPTGAQSIVDPKELDTRLVGYITEERTSGCVPVGKKLVLLDEKTVAGIKEITRNSHIPADKVAKFIEHPTAWLNAEFVDLDLGFSERVQGAAPLSLAYFGETDQSGIQWIEPEKSGPQPETTETSTETSGEEGGLETGDRFEELAEPNVLDIALDDDGESPAELLNVTMPDESLRSCIEIDITALKRQPYPHQDEAIRWLLGLSIDESRDQRWSGALLADDMGLGKTLTVLAFMREYLMHSGANEPALVVAPVSLLDVWKTEIDKTFVKTPFSEVIVLHSSADLKRFKVGGSEREIFSAEPEANAVGALNAHELPSGIRYALRVASGGDDSLSIDKLGRVNSLIITNYETVRDYQFSLARIPWSIAVFDEAQTMKNPNAMVTRAVKALDATFSVVMSGTPVENSLKDFWCLMDRVQRGYLNNYQPFRQKYISPIVSARETGDSEQIAIVRSEVGLRLRKRVSGFMLRRTKEDHLDGLPNKEVILHREFGNPSSGYDDRILCQMPESQQLVYDQIANLAPDESDNNDPSQRGKVILAAINNLKAASLHPDLVLSDKLPLPRSKRQAEQIIQGSGKLMKLLQILETIQAKEEKVLVFVINKSLQMFLQHALKECLKLESLPFIINGDTKIKKSSSRANTSRTEYIDEFQSSPGFDVLILSPIAAGVGLTITEANHVVHIERHWNPAKEAQATDRVYRIGQQRPVSVWVPILKHPTHESFDEKLDRLLTMKSGLSDSVIAPEIVDPTELGGLVTNGDTAAASMLGIKNIHKIKWDLFEALVAILLERDGAEQVILTQGQGDKGCDVVVLGWKGANWLIQCKHKQNPKGQVGGVAIRQVAGARKYYETKLNKEFSKLAVFATVTRFDNAAREASNIEHAVLFGLREMKSLYPGAGVKLQDLLRRKERTEKI